MNRTIRPLSVAPQDLDWAVGQGVISAEQADALWHALKNRQPERPRFEAAHVLYYFGALIVISAMGWLLTSAWEALGGQGLFSIALLYALLFAVLGGLLWRRSDLRIPGGLLVTMAVAMVPLAIYGLERMTGYWLQTDPGNYHNYYEYVRGGWLWMELGTIVAGLVALYFVRFPFLTAPIAFSLWYMSMDLTPLLFGRPDFSWNERLWVSAAFGLVMLLVSYLIDRRTKEDYAFWGYLFGMLAFWSGLSLMEGGSELTKFFYCLINVGLIVLSVLLERRVSFVFGTLGVFGYLGYLAYHVFQDSLLFPVALTGLGLLLIGLGILYQRSRVHLERAFLENLPAGVRRWLPQERES